MMPRFRFACLVPFLPLLATPAFAADPYATDADPLATAMGRCNLEVQQNISMAQLQECAKAAAGLVRQGATGATMGVIKRRAEQLGSPEPIPEEDSHSLVGQIPLPSPGDEQPSGGFAAPSGGAPSASSSGCPAGQIYDSEGTDCIPAAGPEVEGDN